MARRFETGRKPVEYPIAKGISVMMPEGEPPPELTAADKRLIKQTVHRFRRLFMARRRKNRAKADEDKIREWLLEHWPLGRVWGVVDTRGKREVRALVSDVVSREVRDPQRFIEYLGDDAEQIISGLVVPPIVFTEQPERYLMFIELVRKHFGDEVVGQLQVQFSSTEFDKVAESREDQPPPDLFTEGEPTWRIIEQPSKPERASSPPQTDQG